MLVQPRRKRQFDETLLIGKEHFSEWSRKGRAEQTDANMRSKRERVSAYLPRELNIFTFFLFKQSFYAQVEMLNLEPMLFFGNILIRGNRILKLVP